ncbi:SymE family type I addiction module toxin [Pseudomonas sp. LRF_L74]|uniref:SymE family type I addiction module toxin n=1 Tax=Pseudomonas sp. LRF_L74 TaxID=3369422 RepID=UPI003F5FBB08
MITKKSLSPKPRYLTIGYQVYESRHKDKECRYRQRQVPFLRLSGDWLSAAGFTVGQKARIEVTDHGITVRPEPSKLRKKERRS